MLSLFCDYGGGSDLADLLWGFSSEPLQTNGFCMFNDTGNFPEWKLFIFISDPLKWCVSWKSVKSCQRL